jgi:hypothetical protein
MAMNWTKMAWSQKLARNGYLDKDDDGNAASRVQARRTQEQPRRELEKEREHERIMKMILAAPRRTEDEIMAAQTARGGWTSEQLAEWGVPWPPPKGWKWALTQPRKRKKKKAKRRWSDPKKRPVLWTEHGVVDL